MPGPVHRALAMAEHDRAGGAQTHLVGAADDIEPFLCIEFVRANFPADLVVEYLGSRAGQAGEPCLLQLLEEVGNGNAERFGAVSNLESGERVYVYTGRRAFYGGTDIEIGLTGEFWVDAALQ